MQTNDNKYTHRSAPFTLFLERIKLCFALSLIYLLLSILHIGCPIKFITGISCPGCGMTRAIFSLLRFNIRDAFHYHPLFFLTPILLYLFLFEAYIKSKYIKIAWAGIIIVFLGVYLFRLFILPNDIVFIDINGSIVIKLIYNFIVGGFI